MCKKDFFEKAFYIGLQIESKKEQIKKFREISIGTGISISDMPRNPNKGTSRMEGLYIMIEDLEEEIQQLVQFKAKVKKAIDSLTDPVEKTIMEYRYISGLTWKDIAVIVNLSIRELYRIRDKAVKNAVIPTM